jgi:hypothetical protein
MSKHAHTPGPWDYYDMAAYGIAICKGGIGGQNVGHAHMYVGLTAEETTANARLIAAAPELLEALKGVIVNFPAFNRDRHPCLGDALDAARAAIAKAEGGA